VIIADDSDALGDVATEYSAGFILEAQLEAFLVRHWKSIQWGRLLQLCEGPDGTSGHQFVTPIGRLDFLCIDQVTDALVVVELKRGRPSDMVVGQIARYMGYVRSHLAMPQCHLAWVDLGVCLRVRARCRHDRGLWVRLRVWLQGA
jgi:restriction system protein